MIKRSLIVAASHSLLLAGLVALSSCNRAVQTASSPEPPETPTVAVAKVVRQNLDRTLEISAEFRPFQEVEVYSKVAGFVKMISVDYGDRVKQGQVLAVLEVPELVDELDRTTASIRQAEDELKAAQEELSRAESAHNVAHLEYTRLAGVMDQHPGLVAQQEVDGALGRDQESEAKVAAARAAAAACEEKLQEARANERRVRTLLAYTQITAPFRGVVTKRYADVGAMIQQGISSRTQAMPVVRLAQTDVLRLVIPVPESGVPRIKVGEPVDVAVAALNRSYQGRVARFAGQLDLETRTMHTEVDVPNPDFELVPGMYAVARLLLERKSSTLAVPIQAIGREEGRSTVYSLGRDGRIEERTIQVGLETSDVAEVLSGLQENDLVVVGDRSKLKPGEQAQPKLVSGRN